METLFQALMHVEKWTNGDHKSFKLQLVDDNKIVAEFSCANLLKVKPILYSKQVEVEVENKTIKFKFIQPTGISEYLEK